MKATGLLSDDGQMKWKIGVYKLDFGKGGIVERITHIGGAAVEVDPKCNLTKAYKIVDNWSDMGAALHLPPLAPVRLASFFKAGTGPLAKKTWTAQSKEMVELAGATYDAWDAERQRTSAADTTDGTKQLLKDLSTKEKRKALELARDKATATMAQKRVKRQISL